MLWFADSKYTKKKGNSTYFLNIFFDKTTNSSNFACCNSNHKSNGKKNRYFQTVFCKKYVLPTFSPADGRGGDSQC